MLNSSLPLGLAQPIIPRRGSRLFESDRLERATNPPEDAGYWPAGVVAMSSAMESIVDGYVRAKNRAMLEEMRMHRDRLKVNLFLHGQERDYNVSSTIRSLDDDLSVIEAGIERL